MLVTSFAAVRPYWSFCSKGYWPRVGWVRRHETVTVITRNPASCARGALLSSATSTPYGKSVVRAGRRGCSTGAGCSTAPIATARLLDWHAFLGWRGVHLRHDLRRFVSRWFTVGTGLAARRGGVRP